jgi:hypothetical protein
VNLSATRTYEVIAHSQGHVNFRATDDLWERMRRKEIDVSD